MVPTLVAQNPGRAHLLNKCHEGCEEAGDRVISELRPASMRGRVSVNEALALREGTQHVWAEQVTENQQRQAGTPSSVGGAHPSSFSCSWGCGHSQLLETHPDIYRNQDKNKLIITIFNT